MAARPGVMFYFEVRPCLKRLNLEEKGALFEAILDYGEFGVVPELDGAAAVAWDFIQPRIDKDGERYENTIKQREYAVYVREAKKKEEEPLSFEEWKIWKDNKMNHSLSTDNGSYPTTTTNSNSIPTSNSIPIAESTATAGGEKKYAQNPFNDPGIDFEKKRQEQMKRLACYCGSA